MTEPSLDINTYSQQTIPNALAELMDNHNKMQQIASYCKQAYVVGSAESGQIFEQTQSYAKNALLNVAYHIQTIGTHLTTLTQLQMNEIDKLDLQIKNLTQRVEMVHDASGTNVFKGLDSAKPYKSTLKSRQVANDAARTPTKFTRKKVEYGISAMPSNYSSDNLGYSGAGVPPPPASTSSSNLAHSTSISSSQSSTPSISSPPYTSTPPPVAAKRPAMAPPSLNMPPSIPTRPQSVNHGAAGGADFLPPPPPPSFSDLPPPPPSFNNFPPPPPSFNNLPPPPPFGNLPPPPPPM